MDDDNKDIRDELRKVFCVFYDKHINENDVNTCILKVDLSDAVIFVHNYKYVIDFNNETSTKEKFIVDIVF